MYEKVHISLINLIDRSGTVTRILHQVKDSISDDCPSLRYRRTPTLSPLHRPK